MKFLAAFGIVSLSAAVGSAAAQQIAPVPLSAGSEASPLALNAVVVTAQKRPQPALDVPISMTVLGQAMGKADVLCRLDQLTRQVPVIYDAGRSLCEHYAMHFTRLKDAGVPIGANDLWIACHALAQDATLVTNNLREFERVEGLRLENWVG